MGASVARNHAITDFVTLEPASPQFVDDANSFGFSKDVTLASRFWEGDDLTVRLLRKYSSSYFQPNNLAYPDRSNRYVQEADCVDLAMKYKVTKDLSVSFKFINLLDEPQIYTRGNDTNIAEYSRSGPKCFLRKS